MARIITKALAEVIVKKLEGVLQPSRSARHDIFHVYHNGLLVASLSIRRGSDRDQGHDYFPRDLHVGPHFAREIGQCSRDRGHWLAELKDKGFVA